MVIVEAGSPAAEQTWCGAGLGQSCPSAWASLMVCFSQIQHTEDMENEIDELLQEFEEKSGRAFLHTVCFY